MKRDFLSIDKLSSGEVKDLLTGAKVMKHMTSWGNSPKPLKDLSVAMLFRKPSLRTKVSFDVGIKELGGHPIYLSDKEVGIGKRESPKDIAQVLSRYVNLIVMRTFEQKEIEEIAEYASIPVINALTDLLHPCQIMGDALTILEEKGYIDNIVIAYLGDGNNITNSWLNLAKKIPMDLRIATSEETLPNEDILKSAKETEVSEITITQDPLEAVKDAHVIYTDVWASMGQKDAAESQAIKLSNYQINGKLLKEAAPKAIVMHCLPAERGKEITDEVMDGPQSVVFNQAENRLHVQKAIINYLMKRQK